MTTAGQQASTRQWWQTRRSEFKLFVSELVRTEASAGDAEASSRRLEVIAEIPSLPVTQSVEWIANELVSRGLVPTSAEADASHIAHASAHAIDYLLTWNCRHLANAQRLPAVEKFLSDQGFPVPQICTPIELMGDSDDATP